MLTEPEAKTRLPTCPSLHTNVSHVENENQAAPKDRRTATYSHTASMMRILTQPSAHRVTKKQATFW